MDAIEKAGLDQPTQGKRPYVQPALVQIGRVAELTQAGSPNPDTNDNVASTNP